ncbi:helix-turn-helix transcriptional regulator [Actinomadura parmotrematis]|uniref:LuxR family transcriptional regulator n=1 Tax=Actinomadura parmotrematis TaxID=2864039 RepID=A0ABS7FP96_9ACTN|nr:LuxR C-terminal-related transcriptional regulator [Actinomadura parmotrematis]MBW8482126.1 LuxR family transcriptional regulator [Actinomadura parmotrematis]
MPGSGVSGRVLHGRERELGVLAALLDGARAGHGGALVVTAPPGSGRSALLRAVPADGMRVLDTAGVAAERWLPYAGLHRLLHPARPPSRTPFAACSALTGAAAERPLLCRVDDADLLDADSLAALAFTARRLRDVPAVLLFASADPVPPCLADLPRLPLPPLDDEAALHVLHSATGGTLGVDLAVELADLAEGSPLALTELASSLTLEQLAGTAPPPAAAPEDGLVRARHRERYGRLAAPARHAVLLAAVAEEPLPLPALAAATGGTPGKRRAAVDEACAAGLLKVRDGRAEVPGPLLRSSVRAEAGEAGRRDAHRALAGALGSARHRAALADGPDDALADELAASAATARDWQRAAELATDPRTRTRRLLAAARRAWADGRTRRARALLRRVPPSDPEADLLRGEIELCDGRPVVAVWMMLEAADLLAARDRTRALAALVQAGEAADLMGDPQVRLAVGARAARLERPATPATALLVAHATGMAEAHQGRYDEAAGHLGRVLELAADRDPATRASAAVAALTLGDDRLARDLAAQAVAGARRTGDALLEPRALAVLAHCEMALGRYPAAQAAAAEGMRLARCAGQRNRVVEQRAMLGLLAAFAGDERAALAHLAGVTEEAGRRGLTRAAAMASWALAALDLAGDRPADAAARLRTPAGAAPIHPTVRMQAAPHFVEAAVRSGRAGAAERAAAAFERWAALARSPARRALAARCRALVAGDAGDAEGRFAAALRLHESADSEFELARTELLYGQWLRRERRPRDAREHLRNAAHAFAHCGAPRWAEQATAELRAAGDAVAAPSGSLGGLTAQQQQIARLVASGATNREIAARLVISPRTVDHHLRNIFSRLGLRSRVDLARLQLS